MSKITLKSCELHTPLFLAGTNLQMKLPQNRAGMTLEYDREHKELLVTYNGETAIVPSSNIASMVAGAVKEQQPAKANPYQAREAQVSTPYAHVHAGHGHGKTGQEERTRK